MAGGSINVGLLPNIADLCWRVALCSAKDVVVNGSTMEIRRDTVIWSWAQIKGYYGFPVTHGLAGYTILDPRTKLTHSITIPNRFDMLITSAAWVYEERRISPSRWYKVLGYSEPGRFVVLMVRLEEQSDAALPPTNELSPQPNTVPL